MKKTTQIMFLYLILFSMNVNCVDHSEQLLSYLRDYLKQNYPAKGSPEEQRFIMQVKDWTSSDRKFTALSLVFRESLKTASPFIKSLVNISIKNIDKQPMAILTGHSDHANSLSWSPDSNYALSGSADKKIKLWDLRDKQNPKLINTLNGHTRAIVCVSWSPDGNYALSASYDNTIKLWDLTNKQNPKLIKTLTAVRSSLFKLISWSPDGNYALSASYDNTIKLWDLTDKQNPKTQPIATLTGHAGSVNSVSWNPDGNYIVYVSRDNKIRLWDLTDKQNPNIIPIATLNEDEDNNERVYSISWSPDGKYVLSLSEEDKTIKLWNLKDKQNPKLINTLDEHNGDVNSVSWSPNGNYIVYVSKDRKIKLWDLTDKQNRNIIPIATLNEDEDNHERVYSISWSPDGNFVLCAYQQGEIKLWDLSFINLPKQLAKLPDSRDGIIQYLLLSSILEFRKNQQDKTHKLYTQNPKPFIITYPKLKVLFNGLPDVLKESLIKENYVVLK